MKVVIFGPGLGLSPQGDVQVHAAHCPDLNRGHLRSVDKKLRRKVDVRSMEEIVCLVFPPEQFGWDPDDENDWGLYRDKIGWFGCVQKKLPRKPPIPRAMRQIAEWLVEQPQFDLESVLVAFSEWLDHEYGAVFPETLTHDQVVQEFLEFYTKEKEA